MARLNKYFVSLIWINLILVFTVIAAGSIVRATGSGMGCPDWPTCFGKLIPPTNADQVTWRQDKSFKKGEMIIRKESLLVAQSDFISGKEYKDQNWQVYEKHDYAIFNPLHTWVEFINRMVTVVLGFPVILMFFISFFVKEKKLKNIGFSVLVLLLIAFQAWLGKIVVDRNLEGTTITYHMIGVFAILGVLIYMLHIHRSYKEELNVVQTSNLKNLVLVAMILSFVMVILGTQVREEVDLLVKANMDRAIIIDQIGNLFVFHRSFGWLIVLLNGWILFKAIKLSTFTKRQLLIGSIILLEIIVGIILSHYSIPAAAQPIHLFLAALLFSLQLDLFFKLQPKRIFI